MYVRRVLEIPPRLTTQAKLAVNYDRVATLGSFAVIIALQVLHSHSLLVLTKMKTQNDYHMAKASCRMILQCLALFTGFGKARSHATLS